jgi:hypothetical protein
MATCCNILHESVSYCNICESSIDTRFVIIRDRFVTIRDARYNITLGPDTPTRELDPHEGIRATPPQGN